MIRWITATLRKRRDRQRVAGRAWAEGVIEREGVFALKAKLDEDYAVGWGHTAFDEGAIEALQAADSPEYSAPIN